MEEIDELEIELRKLAGDYDELEVELLKLSNDHEGLKKYFNINISQIEKVVIEKPHRKCFINGEKFIFYPRFELCLNFKGGVHYVFNPKERFYNCKVRYSNYDFKNIKEFNKWADRKKIKKRFQKPIVLSLNKEQQLDIIKRLNRRESYESISNTYNIPIKELRDAFCFRRTKKPGLNKKCRLVIESQLRKGKTLDEISIIVGETKKRLEKFY